MKNRCDVCSKWYIGVGFLAFAAAEPLARFLMGESNSISLGAILVAVLFFIAYFMADKKRR